MGVVVRRYIDILTIIINFPYSTCISSFFGSSIPILCSFLKCFFGLLYYILQSKPAILQCFPGIKLSFSSLLQGIMYKVAMSYVN